ncbi:MAG: hypothetical protein ACOYXM_09115 [Actinomycetota bacterium]
MTKADRPASMGEPTRYFFVHLQKTGGTALFQRLRDCFGPAAVYPRPDLDGGVEAVTEVDRMVEAFATRRNELRVMTGHFPLCAVDVLDAPFKTFTVLRDPVERTLSLLRRRSVADERFRDLELEAIYADESLQPIIRNHMVKMLSLTTDEMTEAPLLATVPFDDARLEVAKENLAQRIDVFGLQDHFEDFCSDLEVSFGWDLGSPRFANRTPPRAVSDELRQLIAADNSLDVELYAFATRALSERTARQVRRA